MNGTIDRLGGDLTKQWTYLQWPRHLSWLPVWTPATARMWSEVDALAMKFEPWRVFVERVRTPFMRWIMTKWMQDLIPIDASNQEFRKTYTTRARPERPGLALASADVLSGEIKIFREDDLSLEAVLASGSLDEMGGVTTILAPPNAGTYLDGAWADNPPINELLDYGVDEIWIIQCFPKTIPALPRTPTERRERKDELWQNSLVEHEREFVEFVNHWHKAINEAIVAEIGKRQQQGQLPGQTPKDAILKEHLEKLHRKHGKLPEDLNRLFDESNGFGPKDYKGVDVKTIEIMMPRELGSAIVNAPWFVRNLMHLGYEQAREFAKRHFGSQAAKPAARIPAAWSTIPSPANDLLYGVKPARPAGDALNLACDFCPRRAASTAGEFFVDLLPIGARERLMAVDQAICAVCPKTVMTKLAA